MAHSRTAGLLTHQLGSSDQQAAIGQPVDRHTPVRRATHAAPHPSTGATSAPLRGVSSADCSHLGPCRPSEPITAARHRPRRGARRRPVWSNAERYLLAPRRPPQRGERCLTPALACGSCRPCSSGRATRSSRRSWMDSRTSTMRSMPYRRRRGRQSTPCCWNSAGCGWPCCSAALPSWRGARRRRSPPGSRRNESRRWRTGRRRSDWAAGAGVPRVRRAVRHRRRRARRCRSGAVVEHLGEQGLADFAAALLVVEQRLRLRLTWQRLFEPAS